jgi:hypothetical protein
MIDINEVASSFENFELATHDPKWSSGLLDQLFDTVLSKPQASMTDLFRGFDLALKRNAVDLTETVANLVKDTVITGFTKHRKAYGEAEWDWANHELAQAPSAARSYLFLHALPPDQATPASIVSILQGLEGTPRFEEAIATLSDELERPDVKEEIRHWCANGIGSHTAGRLQSIL